MRTRIALVAIIPIAVVTVSTFTQSATAQSVQSVATRSHGTTPTIRMPPNMSVAYRNLAPRAPVTRLMSLPFDRSSEHLAPRFVTSTGAATPATAAISALAKTRPTAAAKPKASAPVAAPVAAPAAAPAPAPVPSAAPAPAPVPAGPVDTVTPDQRAAWERVAMCEEGGDWGFDGSEFSGGLGISRTNWDAYGGTEFAPEGAEATEDEQIMVAERIQSTPPDQYGCSGW